VYICLGMFGLLQQNTINMLAYKHQSMLGGLGSP
jgi:hypothetical protein